MEQLIFEMTIRGYSDKTIKAYVLHNELFLKFIKKSPRYVTALDIKKYVLHLIENNYQRASINMMISALLFYYRNFLHRRFKIKRLRSQKKLYDVLSKQEIQDMINNATNKKHRLVLKLLYITGIRVSELCNLKGRDIDFSRKMLHVKCGKNRKDRLIPLTSEILKELKNQIRDEDSYIFTTKKGHYSVRSIQKICQNHAKKAGIKKNITPHSLRRTFATHKIENKTDIYRLQKLMGHANTNTTAGYINYSITL